MGKLFGTDGIRGRANEEPMSAETMMKVGAAAGRYFMRGDHQHKVILGKDTRLSGYMIEQALSAGFMSVGMDVTLLGPLPTPGVAIQTREGSADLGVMISASHNPYQDNGIKLFGPDGRKLSDEAERVIESWVAGESAPTSEVQQKTIGRLTRDICAQERYQNFVMSVRSNVANFTGLRVVIDCANGAGYKVATGALRGLGAEVVPLHVDPDGTNINDQCGSTFPSAMCRAVLDNQAHIGFALDGDADRVVAADEQGELLDGDQLMAALATEMQSKGQLIGNGVVATQMSNLGLERYLKGLGLHLVRTRVGDRYVTEQMFENGYNLGGEQSGHIILSDHNATGDGLVTAVKILSMLCEKGKPASEVCRMFKPLPQKLTNIPCSSKEVLEEYELDSLISECENELAGVGRLLVRYSGTEAAVRIMVEAEEESVVHAITKKLAGAVAKCV
ncbi:MAG: phosphoglucosamine mutase [Pseudomonadota bacterium]|nr:phosphoglucosamine mutase [Pseudomonadota bacterium]